MASSQQGQGSSRWRQQQHQSAAAAGSVLTMHALYLLAKARMNGSCRLREASSFGIGGIEPRQDEEQESEGDRDKGQERAGGEERRKARGGGRQWEGGPKLTSPKSLRGTKTRGVPAMRHSLTVPYPSLPTTASAACGIGGRQGKSAGRQDRAGQEGQVESNRR